MGIIGEFGLKNKRELWRVQLTLAKIRSSARRLLTMAQDDPRRTFEGGALLRRLTRLGVLSPEQQRLEYCLSIKAKDFLKRRLQTLVKEIGVESVHRARVLIYQRHIRVGHQVVTSPSFWFEKSRNDLLTSERDHLWEVGHLEILREETSNANKLRRMLLPLLMNKTLF